MKRRHLFSRPRLRALAGCGPIGSALNGSAQVRKILASAEGLNHLVIGTRGLAREYRDRDVDREFRVNGFATPSDAHYQELAARGFCAVSPGR